MSAYASWSASSLGIEVERRNRPKPQENNPVNTVKNANAAMAVSSRQPAGYVKYGEGGSRRRMAAPISAKSTTCHHVREITTAKNRTISIRGSRACAAPAPTITASGWPGSGTRHRISRAVTNAGPCVLEKWCRRRAMYAPLALRIACGYMHTCTVNPVQVIGVTNIGARSPRHTPCVGAVFLWSGVLREPKGSPLAPSGTPIVARPATRDGVRVVGSIGARP